MIKKNFFFEYDSRQKNNLIVWKLQFIKSDACLEL